MRPALMLCAGLALLAPAAARGHATLETGRAAAGSTYKAVVRVGHGCERSPTRTVRVQVPEGLVNAKPMPKPGWRLETKRSAYAKTYDHYGDPMAEGVTEIAWSGGDLPDDWYDEFVFRATVKAEAGARLPVKIVQECEQGMHRWIEVPAAGQDLDELPEPAPILEVTAPAGG